MSWAFWVLACKNDDGVKVYNTPPTASITSPADGSSFDEGEMITLEGVAKDNQDDSDDLTVLWKSDLDGTLETGVVVDADGRVVFTTVNLSPGNHAITLSVVDTEGELDEDSIALGVLDLEDAPVIGIVHPMAGEVGAEGVDFEFVASVSDEQSPADELSVSFTSDSYGEFCAPIPDSVGTAVCEFALPAGEHDLTFIVTDPDGNTATDSFHFEVIVGGAIDDDHDGYSEIQGDCDDTDISVHPGAVEVINGVDDDCDGETDEDTAASDDDGDGQTELEGDCDDGDDDVYLGAPELCDGIDNDCDGDIDEGTVCSDDDGDSYTEIEGDCNDASSAVYPGAFESPDGLDNDCDGITDEGTSAYDDDGDCYCETGPCGGSSSSACGSITAGDCNDSNAAVNPAATEMCNGIDDDCDSASDEADAADAAVWYEDDDGDFYGNAAVTETACDTPTGFVADDTDCDDTDAATNPAAGETCDGEDDDCDGDIDDGVLSTFYRDYDTDSFGAVAITTEACSAPSGYVSNFTDCDDNRDDVYPGAAEYCDGVDNDCNGLEDEVGAVDATLWYLDADDDEYGDSGESEESCDAPDGYVAAEGDCNDLEALINPGQDEVCNGDDDDCDGDTDEADALDAISWYVDDDGDGFGAGPVSETACDMPADHSAVDTDCNDSNADINPSEVEACNGIDDNCDGSADDGLSVTYYYDGDSDGYGDPLVTTSSCAPPTDYVSNNDDCNDSNAAHNPERVWWYDFDDDSYGWAGTTTTSCTRPSSDWVENDDDCNDTSAAASPADTETCDGMDNDCDGSSDELGATGCTDYHRDYDGDTYGSSAFQCTCDPSGSYTSLNDDDCYDSNLNAAPGTSAWWTTSRGDGSYDYTCDGTQEKRYTTNYSCTVDLVGSCDETDGWSTSTDPACGASGTWQSGCTSWFDFGTLSWECDNSSSSSRTQGCR